MVSSVTQHAPASHPGAATADGDVIRLRAIEKVFFTEDIETHALADISLNIHHGEYVAVQGPSGCGKTTLLSILGLLDMATSGEYLLGGESVASLSPSQRAHIRNRQIGFVFQSFNLIGDLTVAENVALPLTYRAMALSERTQRVHEALQSVGMGHRASHFPAQLSGGQQQRIAVARALAGDPLILLADEPTGNLDSANAETIMSLLTELNGQGTTICMVTHDARFAKHAMRTIQLFDGKLVDTMDRRPVDAAERLQ